MTRLSEIRDNLQNTPPRLLKVIDQLLKWCGPALRDHSLCASKGRDPILLRWELMERGLYPYKPGSRPVDILGDGITPRGPYRELGFVVDDYLVGMLTGDVYDNILRLIEREGALFLPARRDEESVRDFLLRMRAWCLRVRPDRSEAVGLSAARGLGDEKRIAHSPDFRSVLWYNTEYSFTPQQAEIVRILWEAFECSTPDVDATLLLSTDFTGSAAKRVRDVFRKSPAWKTMIVPGGSKGTYRLAPPQ